MCDYEQEMSGYDTESGDDENNTYATETECDFIGFMDKLTNDEIAEAESEINERIDEYIMTNIICMSNPDFIKKACDEITEQLMEEWTTLGICNDEDEEELREWVESLIDFYFESMDIPKRQEMANDEENNELANISCYYSNDAIIKEKLDSLKLLCSHDQKSVEWHNARQNLITASNAWKAFSTDAQKNSLIYEKCKLNGEDSGKLGIGGLNRNVDSTLHWGQKYEPVSVSIYEKKTSSIVGEYGCIIHNKYSFLGASPDGIVESGNRIGRMIEVKNIVNRNINGVPLEAYWVQMQMQMEVCDLDECDFIETRFKEYDDEEQFYCMAESGMSIIQGVMALFYSCDGMGTPLYKYMPLDIDPSRENVEMWLNDEIKKLNGEYSFYMKNYWYLDEYMCITVKRNKIWFQSALPILKETWDIIIREREEGYEHRMPKKRETKNGTSQMNNKLMDSILLGIESEFLENDNQNEKNIMNAMKTNTFQVIKKDYVMIENCDENTEIIIHSEYEST